MKTANRNGLAMPMVLQIMAVMFVMVVALGSIGIAHITMMNGDMYQTQAYYAAQAGTARAIYELYSDQVNSQVVPIPSPNPSSYIYNFPNAQASPAGTPTPTFGTNTTTYYTVALVNNFDGSLGIPSVTATFPAVGNVVVPEGTAYIYATGFDQNKKYQRHIGTLIRQTPLGGSGNYTPGALQAGGVGNLGAAGTFVGTVKTNGNLSINANTTVDPFSGNAANFISSSSISAGNGKKLTLSDGGVYASGSISGGNISATPGGSNANSTSTLVIPYINDGRLTNTLLSTDNQNASILPNPNPATLLQANLYSTNTSTTVSSIDFTAANGNTWYFPNGLTFSSGGKITGSGTIVVLGNATFNASMGSNANNSVSNAQAVNIVVVDSITSPGSSGTNSLSFQTAYLYGLVYCSGSITCNTNFQLYGTMISYKGTTTASGANFGITQEAALPFYPRGFEQWTTLLGSSGTGKDGFDTSDLFQIIATQRF